MTQAQQALRDRMVAGAKRWAAAHRSDPFALDTALSHVDNGICGINSETGAEAFYDAEEHVEMRRLGDGTEFPVKVFRNLRRP